MISCPIATVPAMLFVALPVTVKDSESDLAERLRRFQPAIKTLFMSGYTADVIAHHGVLEAGVHYLQKPFSQKEIAFKVREALEDR